MSGILSKIEAVDDIDDNAAEAVDVAVDRVFGERVADAPTPTVEPTNPAPVDPSDLGTPMAPLPPPINKPAPPRAVRGPRANVNLTPPPPAESKPPEIDQARPSPPEPEAKKQAARDAGVVKPREMKPKAGRLPPRLRKKQEQEERARSPSATMPADQKRSTASRPHPTPKSPDAPQPKPAPKAETPTGRRKVARPDALERKHAAAGKSASPAPGLPASPETVSPSKGLPARPARSQESVETQPTHPVPPSKPPLPAPTPAPALAERAAPPPPLPPEPPTGAGGHGGDGGSDRPIPVPANDDPAHEYAALASLKDATDLSNCLLPLLEAMNWRGDPRHVAEALPHFTNALDITSMRNILATLHFQSRPLKTKLSSIDQRLFPCLFLPDNGDAVVLLGYEPSGLRAFDGGMNEERVLPRSADKGMAYFFSPVDEEELQSSQSKVGWFSAVSERFRSLVYQTLGITFVLNVLALVTPLFVMAVYDKVVATGSLPTLAFFAFGVGIAIVCDLILRSIRSKIMAFIGARLDNIVGIAIFHKILFLPPAFTERATIGAQVARIKDFETIRDFFTGPMALVLFELPFVVIFIATIAFLGGPVAFISVIMIACFLILGLIITPLLRNSVSKAARASSRKQELVVETLSGMRAVKYCGAEHKWMERFREHSATAALNSFYTAQLSALMQTVSHVLMISAGLGTIIFGVFRVLNGDMTVGGLVASMILVWRVLAPLQTGFVSLTRLTQVKSSITQINNLMNIRGEREQNALVNPIKKMDGYVTFARVSIRYSAEADPALVGVSFELEPGDVLCIVGGNGSGKSTVLKLLAGMYLPQAGSIRVDNMDIRQMDTVELRHAVAYVPQTIQFFYGTIAQNLRLANPTATDEDLYRACEKAAVLDDVLALSQGSGKWKREGFEVRIGDSNSGQMPTSLLQRLNLARGYLKDSPIMLFDEPGNGLDFAGDQAFMRVVNDMRGQKTMLMVTHRPSHMKIADKILWLEHGNVRAFGPAPEVLQQMPKDFV